MAKIRCLHCAAINQDVTEKDACWQCGKPLGSKSSSSEDTTKSSAASTTNFRESNVKRLQEIQDAPPKKGLGPLIGVVMFILALIFIAVFIFASKK